MIMRLSLSLTLALTLALTACSKDAPEPAPAPAAPDTEHPAPEPSAPEPSAPEKTAPPSVAAPGFLEDFAETWRFRLGHPRGLTVAPDGAVLFLRSGPRSFVHDLYELDPATGKERVLLTADALLDGAEESLSEAEKARRERQRVAARGIASFDLSADGQTLLVPLSGQLYLVDRATKEVTTLPDSGGPPIDPQLAPGGAHLATVRGRDLYVIDVATGTQRRLTTSPRATLEHGLAEFVAQEEMGRHHGFWWAPDGKALAFQETDHEGVETLYIADPGHPEREPVATFYPRPGMQNASVRLGVVSVDGGDPVWIDWDRARFPYLVTVRWQQAAPLTLVVQDRRQRELVVLAADPATGATTELLRETDAAWLNIDQTVPRWVLDGQAFLWSSERSGAWQLELRGRDGALLRALTEQAPGYDGVLHVADGQVFFSGSDDPTESHVLAVPLTGATAPRRLTEAPGLHGATFGEGDPASTRWVHHASTLDGPTTYTVRDRASREAVATIAAAAEAPPFSPTTEVLTLGPDARDVRAAVIRPRNFVAGQRYPVIVHVYGGPHWRMVQKRRDSWLLDQWFADHGFIVVAFDGRGTPGRGRAWERAISGDVITPPLDDQVAALTALAARVPELDLSRVGVYGWSFGGYFSLHAVMQHPDVFHAGVAGAPVVDWRDYDTHYTERYLQLPDDDGGAAYDLTNVLTYAKDLSRPLLVIHGTADDNVYFVHALKVADALFRAGKPFELLPLVDFTHMVTDPEVAEALYGRMLRFFVDHVAHRKP